MGKKVVLIIQARMGSSRLPGKSMLNLAGVPLVGRIIERVKRCKNIDEIVLSIPLNSSDDVLEELGKDFNVLVSRGEENNLIQRYHKASKENNADIVVRLPADNATPEPLEIDKIINFHIDQTSRGFSSNLAEIFNSGYPDGIGAEVFESSFLDEIIKKDTTKIQKEHIHLNFYNYDLKNVVDSEWCPVRSIKCPNEYSRPDLILDVNTKKQYDFMKSIYEYLYPRNPEFSIIDIVNWYDNVYKQKK